MREIPVVFDPERKLYLYTALTLLAIVVGPFGTYELMTLWQRTIFWSLDVIGGLAIIVPAVHAVHNGRLLRQWPSLARFVLGAALGALPAAAYITLLFNSIGADLEITTPFPLLFVQVTIFSSLLLLVEYVVWPKLFGSSGDTGAETPAPIPLLSRMSPEHRGSEILSISMQDHYAQITTTTGTEMLLMRLSDAIDLLGAVPGVQIHRSHWVAKDAAVSLERNGRRSEVLLQDGRRLPVGNTYKAAVQSMLASYD